MNVREMRWEAARFEGAGACIRVRVPSSKESGVSVIKAAVGQSPSGATRSYFEFFVPQRALAEQIVQAFKAFAVPLPDRQ